MAAEGKLKAVIANIEKGPITEELRRSHGNMSGAAGAPGITEGIMGLRVKKFRIDLQRFK